MENILFGIDYGEKYSGTTIICHNYSGQVRFLESDKKSDADSFILSEVIHLHPSMIFINAPLSLPGIYWLKNGYRDHFYRQCDREAEARSPMDEGALTARAMKLKAELKSTGCKVFETQPAMLAGIMELKKAGYHEMSIGHLERFIGALTAKVEIDFDRKFVRSWHHADALLVFLSGMRYINKEHKVYGKKKEGLIIV